MREIHRQEFTPKFHIAVGFTCDLFSPANPTFSDLIAGPMSAPQRLAIFVDRGVAAATPGLTADIESYVERRPWLAISRLTLLEGGARARNEPSSLAHMHALFDRAGVDRRSLVVAVGGGSVLDTIGFAAAQHGVRFVRVPTTVLAQSSIGVRRAIHAFGRKDLLAALAPPFAVACDTAFLPTQPRRDQRAGLAEALRIAVVHDLAFFRWIWAHTEALTSGEEVALAALVRRSARLHLTHLDSHLSDFGQWAAYKLEALTSYRLRHGEALAVGIAVDTAYSLVAGLLEARAAGVVLETLARLGLPIWDDALEDPRLEDGLEEMREHLGGHLNLPLLASLGHGVQVQRRTDGNRLRRVVDMLQPRAHAVGLGR